MTGTQKTLLTLLVGATTATANAAPADKFDFKCLDYRMDDRLYFLPKDAKADQPFKTEGVGVIESLKDPTDKEEVKKKKALIYGFPGNYSLGYYVFYDWTKNTFPNGQKSIYVYSGVGTSLDKISFLGTDITLPDTPGDPGLNAPWQQTKSFTWRTSTMKVMQLKLGMNFVVIRLDPNNKVAEFTQPILEDGKEGPVTRLEANNKAVFAIEIKKPAYLDDIAKPK